MVRAAIGVPLQRVTGRRCIECLSSVTLCSALCSLPSGARATSAAHQSARDCFSAVLAVLAVLARCVPTGRAPSLRPHLGAVGSTLWVEARGKQYQASSMRQAVRGKRCEASSGSRSRAPSGRGWQRCSPEVAQPRAAAWAAASVAA